LYAHGRVKQEITLLRFHILAQTCEVTPTIIAVVVLGVVCSAGFFFALAESSLFSLSKWQVRALVEKWPVSGTMVSQLLSNPQDLLATIAFGNSFANATVVAIMLWGIFYHEPAHSIVILGATALFLLFGTEVSPKTLAVRAPEEWALRVARPMLFLLQISRPFRAVAQWCVKFIARGSAASAAQHGWTDAEYQELLEMAFQQGALAAGEKEIILQIINLEHHQSRDVMRPRSQMACISDELSVEEMIESARRFRHRRLPMYDESPDTIVGVLNTRALLLEPDGDLANAIEFPSFVPESMNLLQLLKSLQRQQRGMAIVLDEFGSTAGIITIEDIMAEIVGEFRRKDSSHGFMMKKLDGGRWRVNGTMRLDDFRREYPLPEIPGVETMGGLVLHVLEVAPVAGDVAEFQGLRLTVTSAAERRARELLVEVVRKK